MAPLEWYRIAAPVGVCGALVVLAVVRPVARLRFAALGLVALVGYAVMQDQVSARLCPEYFTRLHPPIPDLTDPTLLGIAWGFLGAWWGGVLMGYAVGLTATVGKRPPLTPRELVGPMAVLVACVAAVTAITGVAVWRHAELFDVTIDVYHARLVPPERHRALVVVACYHFAAYGAAVLGSVVLCGWVARERRNRALEQPGRNPERGASAPRASLPNEAGSGG